MSATPIDPDATTGSEQPTPPSPPPPSHPRVPFGEKPGDFIGPYKLLELIGEGGFGVVWLAERREPMVQRVALKVIKPGMDSRAVIARFEQERQALAVMDHPNVARVLDGGVTPTGRPYFVMEHVKGESITTFCDRNRLTIKQRLELFIHVCEAVQHAHMKGIIHRDLKPGNILIASVTDQHVGDGATTRGMLVKVIDFGVAKAISHSLTDKTIFTEQGQIIGTPEYMSPEQAEMGRLDIDTRTDVYSLGVVLYELLAGILPFDSRTLRAAGYAEIQRIIREVDAPRPSTKLSTADDETGAAIARARQAERERIAGELRRELEWIPLKALRKDRARRYPSAEALCADIRRYLDGQPLDAAPESRTYLLRKLLQRNRAVFLTASCGAVAVLIGAIAMTWMYFQADAARKRADLATKAAEQRSAESSRANRFLSTLLRLGDPISHTDSRTESTTDLDVVLQNAAGRIDSVFAGDPIAAATWRAQIGSALLGIGPTGQGTELLRIATESLTSLKGEADPETLRWQVQFMRGLLFDGRPTQAIALGAELVPRLDTIENNALRTQFQHQVTAFRITALRALGRYEDVITDFNAFVAAQAESYEPGQLNSANLGDASTAYLCLGNVSKARELADRAVHETLQWAHPDQVNSIYAREHQLELAAIPPESLSPSERLKRHLQLWEDARRTFGHTNARVIHKQGAIALLLVHAGRPAQAAAVLRESLTLRREVFGLVDGNTHWAAWNLAKLLTKSDQAASFLAECQALADLAREHHGPLSAEYVGETVLVATVLEAMGRPEDAVQTIMGVEQAASELDGAHVDFRRTWVDKASGLLHGAGRVSDGQKLVSRELGLDPTWARGWQILGWEQRRLGNAIDAEASLRRALSLDPRPNAGMHLDLANALRDQRRLEEALGEADVSARLSPQWADAAWTQGLIDSDLDHPAEAERCFRRAVELSPDWSDAQLRLGLAIKRNHGNADAVDHIMEAARLAPDWAWAAFEAGRILVELGRFSEAEPHLVRACALDAVWGDHWLHLGRALEGMNRSLDAFCAYHDGSLVDPGREDLRKERDRTWSTLSEPDKAVFGILESLRQEHVLAEEIARAIENLSDMPEETRTRLRDLTRRLAVTRFSVNDAAWRIVRSPEATAEFYSRGLALAREAVSPHPRAGWPSGINEPSVQNTLGFAFLRTGSPEEAVAAFLRSNALLRDSGQAESPLNWAGLALGYDATGNREQSRIAADHFRGLAADARWASDPEVLAFAEELRGLRQEK